MITEDYVSYEVAKLLKEKGFDIFKSYGWDEELFDKEHPRNFSISFDNKEHWISCPTHQMAMKWLREVHKICIVIQPTATDNDGIGGCLWKYIISKRLEFKKTSITAYEWYHLYEGACELYEEACESAIMYCLNNLITSV